MALVVALLESARAQAPGVQVQVQVQVNDAIERGVIAGKQREYALAIRYFEQARKLSPRDATALFNLGLAESQLPGRELRASAWFGAYRAARRGADQDGSAREQLRILDVKAQSTAYRMIRALEDVVRPLPDWDRDLALGRVADFWLAAGDPAAAARAAQSMKSALSRNSILAKAAKRYANLGDYDTASRIADLIPSDDKDRSFAHSYIVEEALKRGDQKVAEQSLRVIGALDVKARTYALFAEWWRVRGNQGRYLDDIRVARETASTWAWKTEKYHPDDPLRVVSLLANVGELEQAWQATLPGKFASDAGRAWALEILVKEEIANRRFEGALRTYAAWKLIKSESDWMLRDIVVAAARAGETKRALSLAPQVSETNRKKVLEAIIQAQLLQSDHNGASLTAEGLDKDARPWQAYNIARSRTKALVEQGNIDDAVALADGFAYADYKERLQAELIVHMARAARSPGDLMRVEERARRVISPQSVVKANAAVAAALSKSGRRTEARQQLTTAADVAAKFPSRSHYGPLRDMYNDLGEAFLLLGDRVSAGDAFAKARGILSLKPETRYWQIKNIAEAQARGGDAASAKATFADAMQVAELITRDIEPAAALANIEEAARNSGIVLTGARGSGPDFEVWIAHLENTSDFEVDPALASSEFTDLSNFLATADPARPAERLQSAITRHLHAKRRLDLMLRQQIE